MKACRTGGTSILRMTLEQHPLDTFHYKDDTQRFNRWLRRICDEELHNYRIFSIVRNPWDRAVSIAAYFRIPFRTFVAQFEALTSNHQNLRQHAMPLHIYTHLNDSPYVDMIGRFEQLQEDFDSICGALGINLRSKIPVSNTSQRVHFSNYYDADLKSRLETIYREDTAIYGYSW